MNSIPHDGAYGVRPRTRLLKDHRIEDENGFTLMTLAYLQQLSLEQKGYKTPYLNDTIYLHYKGFSRISEAMLEYNGLKSLWLENNAISNIENVETLKELKCLFLQNNCLSEFAGLVSLVALKTLNISANSLFSLPSELAQLPHLSSLHANDNRFRNSESLAVLNKMKSLTVLDLYNNNLDDEDVFDSVFWKTPSLIAVLTLHGNPVVRKTANYRRKMISAMPELKYLDQNPISDNERRLSTAWITGGTNGEQMERQRQRDEERAERERNFAMLEALRRGHTSSYQASGSSASLARWSPERVLAAAESVETVNAISSLERLSELDFTSTEELGQQSILLPSTLGNPSYAGAAESNATVTTSAGSSMQLEASFSRPSGKLASSIMAESSEKEEIVFYRLPKRIDVEGNLVITQLEENGENDKEETVEISKGMCSLVLEEDSDSDVHD